MEVLDVLEDKYPQEEVNEVDLNNDEEINRTLRHNWALVSNDDASWDANNDSQSHDEDDKVSGFVEGDDNEYNNSPTKSVQEDNSVKSILTDNDEILLEHSENESRSKTKDLKKMNHYWVMILNT